MLFRILILILALGTAGITQAELVIEINKGNDEPLPIAIVPFGWSAGVSVADDVASIVESDLHRSGLFDPLSRNDMLSRPTASADVFFKD